MFHVHLTVTGQKTVSNKSSAFHRAHSSAKLNPQSGQIFPMTFSAVMKSQLHLALSKTTSHLENLLAEKSP